MASPISSYDYIVIGAGLSGLYLAAQLSQHTSKVLLVDEGESFGGTHRSYQSDWGALNATIQHFPFIEGASSAIKSLEDFLGIKLVRNLTENNILTYEKGELTKFIGFGDYAPEFFNELSAFLSSQKMEVTLEWGEVLNLIRGKFKGDLLQRTVVTALDFDDDKIQGVILNGSKKMSSSNVIYCGNLKRLYPLIHLSKDISGKIKTKISKGPYWSVLRLDLFFSQEITQNMDLHLLSGASNEDVTPCLGRFWPANSAGQGSQWLTFLPALEAEESELVGEALKKIKRQVKRAYADNVPDMQKLIAREKITMLEYHLGGDLKLDADMKMPGLTGLWIGSSQLSSEKSPLAGLLQGEKVLRAFGFENSIASENAPVLTTTPGL